MLIRSDQFHGVRPRRDPRLLAPFEAQVATNARLWSGALASWRRPSDVQAIGKNSLRWSNAFENAAWAKIAVTVLTNNGTAGDGSTTADKLQETATNSLHLVSQSVAKLAAVQTWTWTVEVDDVERAYAVIQVSDGSGSNLVRRIVHIASGAVTNPEQSGTFQLVSISSVVVGTTRRVTMVVTTGAESTVVGGVGPASGATTHTYLGTAGSGIFAARASLRQASAAGTYRETASTALSSIASIYLYKSQYWIATGVRASIAKGPVLGDTTDALYFTGGPANRPSYSYDPLVYNGNSGRGDMPRAYYSLGLPSPSNPPDVTITPQSGTVTDVSSVIATKANQTLQSFSMTGVTTDGYQILAQANFAFTIISTTSHLLVATMRISRGGRIVAETERKIALEDFAGSAIEVTDILVEGVDQPAQGTYTYDYEVLIVAVDGGSFSASYNITDIKAYYDKVKIKVGAGHPFRIGDRISVAGVTGFEAVNTALMEIVAIGSDFVWVDVRSSETYISGGTWQLAFDDDERQDTAYVLTFLTQVGAQVQEGPPSDPSEILSLGSGEPVHLTNIPTTPPGDGGTYNLTGKRLYRNNVDSEGNAAFYFVAELAIATTSHTDNLRFNELGEELPSTDWIKPPTDLTGLTSVSGGSLAGFSGNILCFSEPYQPHAWPTKYQIPIEYPPVAVRSFGENTFVGTLGKPVLVLGVDPANMRPVPMQLSEPCVAIDSVVDMGSYLVYAGDSGLVLVSSSQNGVITDQLFTKEEWQEISPETIRAGRYDSRYIGFFTRKDGSEGGFVFDPKEATATWMWLDFAADVCWTDPASGDLYLVVEETIQKWDSHPTLRYTYKWRSKQFVLDRPVCPAYAKVVAESYPVDFQLFVAKDPEAPDLMTLLHTRTVQNGNPFALPDGYESDVFEYEITGVAKVKRVAIASSIRELQRVR